MKQIFVSLLVLGLLIGMTGCKKENDDAVKDEVNIDEVIDSTDSNVEKADPLVTTTTPVVSTTTPITTTAPVVTTSPITTPKVTSTTTTKAEVTTPINQQKSNIVVYNKDGFRVKQDSDGKVRYWDDSLEGNSAEVYYYSNGTYFIDLIPSDTETNPYYDQMTAYNNWLPDGCDFDPYKFLRPCEKQNLWAIGDDGQNYCVYRVDSTGNLIKDSTGKLVLYDLKGNILTKENGKVANYNYLDLKCGESESSDDYDSEYDDEEEIEIKESNTENKAFYSFEDYEDAIDRYVQYDFSDGHSPLDGNHDNSPCAEQKLYIIDPDSGNYACIFAKDKDGNIVCDSSGNPIIFDADLNRIN